MEQQSPSIPQSTRIINPFPSVPKSSIRFEGLPNLRLEHAQRLLLLNFTQKNIITELNFIYDMSCLKIKCYFNKLKYKNNQAHPPTELQLKTLKNLLVEDNKQILKLIDDYRIIFWAITEFHNKYIFKEKVKFHPIKDEDKFMKETGYKWIITDEKIQEILQMFLRMWK